MKKVLAWAVALALVLSSFTMAFAADTANASQFKDADQINYTEAVDVMVATGVINGYPDGTFGPAKTVKRAEMAKMISVMLEGGEDIGDQFKGACPFADSKNHWAAGYIAYCASEHIIDGRSADVFDPEAEVTGTEVAKMALTALGYDSQIQGYVGENWAANVLKDAKKNDLFEGLNSDFVPADPCSREEAAQILFNCLQATMVEYNNSTTVEVGDAKVTVNSAVKDQTWPDGSTKDDNGNGTKQLYEDAFGGDLHKTPSTSDDFGRPAHKWSKEKDEIGTYPDAADSDAVAEEGQTVAEAVEDVNSDGKVGTVTLNGVEGYEGEIFAGDKVEMFETDTDDVYDVVITRYQLAQITAVDTNITAKDAKKDKDLTAYVSINEKKYFDTKVAGYDAATYEEDAYIAVAFKGDEPAPAEILDSYIAETQQGELTEWTEDVMSIGDTDYTRAGTYDKAYGLDVKSGSNVGDTVDVYFDKNGYALGAYVAAGDEPLVAVFSDFTFKMSPSTMERPPIDNMTLVDETGAEKDYALTNAGKTAAYSAYAGKLPRLVQYELTDAGKVKNVISSANEVVEEGGSSDFGTVRGDVNKRGIVANLVISEDVVAYYYSEDADDSADSEWIIYGYEDLLETTITADAEYVLNSDGEIAYMLLSQDISGSEDTVMGFFSDWSYKTDKDGFKVTVELMLPDGTTKKYTTKANLFANADDAKDVFDLCDKSDLIWLELNGDGEVTGYEDGYDMLALSTEADGDWDTSKDEYGYLFGVGEVTKASKSTIWMDNFMAAEEDGGESIVPNVNVYIGDANVYKVNYDANMDVDSLSSSKATSIKAGDFVIVMQLDAESDAWDTVLYITAADMAAMQEMMNTYTVDIAPTENGTVKVDKTNVVVMEDTTEAEKTVTITATPDEGYEVDTITVKDEDGQDVSVADNKFVMPKSDVTVTVTFTHLI